MKKREFKIYNLIFPIWILWMIPITWFIVIPANFLIDLIVTSLTMKYLKIEDIKKQVKSVIAEVWLFGFIADFIGSTAMYSISMINFGSNDNLNEWWYNNITAGVCYNPLQNIYSILCATVCVIITGLFIYLFNYKICLRKLDIRDVQKKKLALSLAVFTAPYLFYIPTAWFVG